MGTKKWIGTAGQSLDSQREVTLINSFCVRFICHGCLPRNLVSQLPSLSLLLLTSRPAIAVANCVSSASRRSEIPFLNRAGLSVNFPASTAVSKHSVAPMHHALLRFVEMYFVSPLELAVRDRNFADCLIPVYRMASSITPSLDQFSS